MKSEINLWNAARPTTRVLFIYAVQKGEMDIFSWDDSLYRFTIAGDAIDYVVFG